MKPDTQEWLSKRFGIPLADVLWYNSGTCYDRIGVATKESADKVSKKVAGQTANGGMLDGMPLGGQIKSEDKETGKTSYEVYC